MIQRILTDVESKRVLSDIEKRVNEQYVLFCAKSENQIEELKLHVREDLVEKAFSIGIENGNLKLIKYFLDDNEYQVKLMNTKENLNKSIQEAASNNHINVIKYLLEESKIKDKFNIHNDCERAFSLAHRNGAKDVLQYFIFDLEFEKNKHIKYAIKQKSNVQTNDLFKIRKVASELREEFKKDVKINNNNKKRKI